MYRLLAVLVGFALLVCAGPGSEPGQPVAWDSLPQHLQRRRPGAWTEADIKARSRFVRDLAARADARPETPLIGPVEDLRRLIETQPRVFMHFSQMFDQIPWRPAYLNDSSGLEPEIRDYKHMLRVLNHVATTAPTLDGHAAFLDPDVNDAMGRILAAWRAHLESPKSRTAMNRKSENSWLGPTTLTALERLGNAPYNTTLRFDELYECDASDEDFFGFASWDDFFARRLRPGVRPVASPDDDDVIVSACEASPYNVARGVKLRDTFFAKGQPYSVLDMLGHDPLAEQFAGGTVYQAFLTPLSYHRWSAPVSGVVWRAMKVPGAYFSIPLSLGVGNRNISDIPSDSVVQSQSYLTSMSARAVIIIKADNPAIGLMAFVAVGMTDVSSCEVGVREGQHVRKGDDLGTFHYGGSSHCLLFREGVELEGLPTPGNVSLTHVNNVAVRGRLAVVKRN
ncbi:hypothetical protein L249_5562 [Ophiocordyceps polyrhachis-furcata BCC 54312]|uniref:L-tryptophan decarboxylase PsiD-like domain-containing protein n=1 Tax=Ophiocordyceps polyrhachis-furcata BCC 54312 TaxID=1330021 RepID=A0A367LH88_9HYPO|nr:hypothetical protein L249_5562 [Ophiocordyceps polyrhachis-furcata BCC 54312]